ncbi:MAG: UdgX family uracil-DNA binding protein, partial [Verrucomicrobiales bacterium]|nr:UdgX family uracil-DNA binding protein [Verrucomicrobiales bacterium]
IFNPARVKLEAMRAEMPMKYWKNLPEAALIPGLTAGAAGRVQEMVERGVNSDRGHVSEKRPAGAAAGGAVERVIVEPAEVLERAAEMSLGELRNAVDCCRACPLWEGATQAVGGEGNEAAEVMLVGEQPGDQEDVAGRVFVGPAGRLLDEALEAAGLRRGDLYLTNAVKHFKWKPAERGKRRLHDKANAAEVAHCRPWMLAEVVRIRPRVIVALGATAAGALLGRHVTIGSERGWAERVPEGLGARVLITTHPSFVLRCQDPGERGRAFAGLVDDLKRLGGGLGGVGETGA